MSGHSKWANIKHRKSAQDAKKGKVFTRIGKEITIAAKEGGGNPDANFRLRTIIDKAREANMPADNIQRSIKRGTGELPGVSYEEQLYEGYGPESVAVLVACVTDNKNRTVAEVRRVFNNNGGNLAEAGAVSWMFEKKGVIRINAGGLTEDDLLEQLIDFGIDDIDVDDDIATITVNPKQLEQVKKVLADSGHKIESAELEFVAKNSMGLSEDKEKKVFDFLEKLEDLDDVQNVYTNLK
ncbi:TPA: YebC/PmpR family DNA-binding transcriptional regulator [Candidatus Dependentiae bacterium]|nr:MAG: Transcriptional regulator [candidate division TM6 bacterium GW2011_GWF2_36_131]KKQ03278.1 MAG: Transcriptional regulator [candidate division TM6 bacterium GW2011_GWE2_36_25]KKQ19200.1 MAG: Transcriptional regulator [candidate division TM6 bacterium GW2011_GWA2_36_9]HBR70294.1 YebC/PmpR family DNA-binding transcriptional regulator [Candidatus Dependentiae bacterium]HCU00839.1 YebC/PmpR family DNA-binding transcriptional regulator [Candidatus Dependentiae bacterium]